MTVLQITKDDGSAAYIRVTPRYDNAYQLYQSDQAGHLHFTTTGIAPEIGDNTPVLQDKDNPDHLGEYALTDAGDWTYTGNHLSSNEQAQLKERLLIAD